MELSANDIDQLRACVNGNLEFHEEAVRLSSYCLCLWQVLPNDNSCNNWCPSGKGERNIIGIKEASSITEVRPLKRVAREKWGTHDALRASRPGNEVVKAADVFGFLWS